MTTFLINHQLIESLLKLSKLKATGTVKELAKRYDISERTVKRMIETLKCEGHNVVYDRSVKSYIIK